MTTFISAARSVRALKSWPAVLAAVAAFALAGCESGANILNGEKTAPQAQITAPPAAPPAAIQLAKLAIAPPIGAPENVALDLQSQLGSAIERNKVTVAKGPNAKAEYTVRGYVVAAREKAGSKISYIWDVTDQADKKVHRITGEEIAAAPAAGKDPWSSVTPQIVQTIADKTAAQIASWLPGPQVTPVGVPVASNAAATGSPVTGVAPAAQGLAQSSVPPATGAAASATPNAVNAALNQPQVTGPTTGSTTGPVLTLVPAVIGAPGDGGASLTSAIQRELQKSGLQLASVPGASTYRVEGKVALGQGKDGKQPITIDWNVVDPAGKKLGTVSQKNEVPQGSLDGTWGKTADAAAAAAAQGIVKLLPQPAKAN